MSFEKYIPEIQCGPNRYVASMINNVLTLLDMPENKPDFLAELAKSASDSAHDIEQASGTFLLERALADDEEEQNLPVDDYAEVLHTLYVTSKETVRAADEKLIVGEQIIDDAAVLLNGLYAAIATHNAQFHATPGADCSLFEV